MRTLLTALTLFLIGNIGFASDDKCNYSMEIESTQINGKWDLDKTSEFFSFATSHQVNSLINDVSWSRTGFFSMNEEMVASDHFETDQKSGAMRLYKNQSPNNETELILDSDGNFSLYALALEADFFGGDNILLEERIESSIDDLDFDDEGRAFLKIANKNAASNIVLTRFCRL